MVKKEFLSYEAPQVEIIEVEVEKGFATSGGSNFGDGGSDGNEDM